MNASSRTDLSLASTSMGFQSSFESQFLSEETCMQPMDEDWPFQFQDFTNCLLHSPVYFTDNLWFKKEIEACQDDIVQSIRLERAENHEEAPNPFDISKLKNPSNSKMNDGSEPLLEFDESLDEFPFIGTDPSLIFLRNDKKPITDESSPLHSIPLSNDRVDALIQRYRDKFPMGHCAKYQTKQPDFVNSANQFLDAGADGSSMEDDPLLVSQDLHLPVEGIEEIMLTNLPTGFDQIEATQKIIWDGLDTGVEQHEDAVTYKGVISEDSSPADPNLVNNLCKAKPSEIEFIEVPSTPSPQNGDPFSSIITLPVGKRGSTQLACVKRLAFLKDVNPNQSEATNAASGGSSSKKNKEKVNGIDECSPFTPLSALASLRDLKYGTTDVADLADEEDFPVKLVEDVPSSLPGRKNTSKTADGKGSPPIMNPKSRSFLLVRKPQKAKKHKTILRKLADLKRSMPRPCSKEKTDSVAVLPSQIRRDSESPEKCSPLPSRSVLRPASSSPKDVNVTKCESQNGPTNALHKAASSTNSALTSRISFDGSGVNDPTAADVQSQNHQLLLIKEVPQTLPKPSNSANSIDISAITTVSTSATNTTTANVASNCEFVIAPTNNLVFGPNAVPVLGSGNASPVPILVTNNPTLPQNPLGNSLPVPQLAGSVEAANSASPIQFAYQLKDPNSHSIVGTLIPLQSLKNIEVSPSVQPSTATNEPVMCVLINSPNKVTL